MGEFKKSFEKEAGGTVTQVIGSIVGAHLKIATFTVVVVFVLRSMGVEV